MTKSTRDSEVKKHVKRVSSLVNSQQQFIGGERLSWEDVKHYRNYNHFDDNFREFGDCFDPTILNFLPKPIEVIPRKTGFTSMGTPQECHSNVRELVKRYGGEHIKGLEMFDSGIPKGVYLNPHSIWKTPEGKFVDVTPLEVVGGDEGETEPRPQPYLFIPLLRVSENLWIDLPDYNILKFYVRDDFLYMLKEDEYRFGLQRDFYLLEKIRILRKRIDIKNGFYFHTDIVSEPVSEILRDSNSSFRMVG